jgi:phosphoenolpyruvate-protein kinase (PTS system EI component)
MVIGACGEHGGDPSSIQLFHEIGIDYVRCSPHRVPVARLAAAQAAVRDTAEGTPNQPARPAPITRQPRTTSESRRTWP